VSADPPSAVTFPDKFILGRFLRPSREGWWFVDLSMRHPTAAAPVPIAAPTNEE